MGINVLLFVVVQVGLEPRRRKRLVRGFEDKVKEAVMQIPQKTGAVIQQLPLETQQISFMQQIRHTPHDTPDSSIEEAKVYGEEKGMEDALNDEAENEVLE